MVYQRFQSLSPAGLLIDKVEIGPDRIVITARCRAAAGTCPECGRQSGRVRPTIGPGSEASVTGVSFAISNGDASSTFSPIASPARSRPGCRVTLRSASSRATAAAAMGKRRTERHRGPCKLRSLAPDGERQRRFPGGGAPIDATHSDGARLDRHRSGSADPRGALAA